MNDDAHRCLVCNTELIPTCRAFCRRCFVRVPWKLRAEVMRAWRLRVIRRRECDEKLIELRQWAGENRIERSGW